MINRHLTDRHLIQFKILPSHNAVLQIINYLIVKTDTVIPDQTNDHERQIIDICCVKIHHKAQT